MIPATSQLSLLSSTTTINVWLGSNGVSERLRSFSGLGCCFGLRICGSIGRVYIRADGAHLSVNNLLMDAISSPRPIASLGGMGPPRARCTMGHGELQTGQPYSLGLQVPHCMGDEIPVPHPWGRCGAAIESAAGG